MTFADLSPVANHLWQSTVCVAVVWLATLALKRNRAAVRYWLWFAASMKFLIPFSPLADIGAKLTWRTAAAAVQPQWSFVMDNVATPFGVGVQTVPDVAPHGSFPLPTILIGVWLCGVAAGLAVWLYCWRKMRTARRLATPVALGLTIPVMSSPLRIEPGVFGILRPVLLLPEGIADTLTPPQFEAIVAHEMCHVRRSDNLTAAIHMLVETIFWFHPLVWWIGTRLVEERERACDEEVIRLGSDPETYAEGIIGVCKSYIESPVACVSGISGSDLKKRILRIVTHRLGEKLTLGRKMLLAAIAIAGIACPLAFGVVNAPLLLTQSSVTDWEKAAGGKMAFDVASVKRDTADMSKETVHSNISLGPEDVFTPTGGLLSSTNYPVIGYMIFAYKLTPSQVQSLQSQVPKWANSERYDIEARASGDPTKDQFRLMMQALLADRFKLAIHYETKQVPVFALVLNKSGKFGSGFQQHPVDSPCSTATGQETIGTVTGGFPKSCGALAILPPSTPGRIRLGARNVPMAYIAICFTAPVLHVDRPVLDKTGLTGKYDFVLEFTPEIPASANFQPDQSGPTFLEALNEQLGLRLDSQTGPADVFVVDHIEEPSEN